MSIQFLRGPADVWAAINPILLSGQPGFEIDTFKLKIGNGQLPWNDLPYIGGSGGGISGIAASTGINITIDNSGIYNISFQPSGVILAGTGVTIEYSGSTATISSIIKTAVVETGYPNRFVQAIIITNSGSGYIGGDWIYFDPPPQAGTTAEAIFTTDEEGKVEYTIITEPGAGYIVPPNIFISGTLGPSGYYATGIVVLSPLPNDTVYLYGNSGVNTLYSQYASSGEDAGTYYLYNIFQPGYGISITPSGDEEPGKANSYIITNTAADPFISGVSGVFVHKYGRVDLPPAYFIEAKINAGTGISTLYTEESLLLSVNIEPGSGISFENDSPEAPLKINAILAGESGIKITPQDGYTKIGLNITSGSGIKLDYKNDTWEISSPITGVGGIIVNTGLDGLYEISLSGIPIANLSGTSGINVENIDDNYVISLVSGIPVLIAGSGIDIDQNESIYTISSLLSSGSGINITYKEDNNSYIIASTIEVTGSGSIIVERSGDIFTVTSPPSALAEVISTILVGTTGVHIQSSGENNTVTITFSSPIISGSVIYTDSGDPERYVDYISVTDGGQWYEEPPEVIIGSPPNEGETALATASILGGQVIKIEVTNKGSKYIYPPIVTIQGGSGVGAKAVAVLSDDVGAIYFQTGTNENVIDIISLDRSKASETYAVSAYLAPGTGIAITSSGNVHIISSTSAISITGINGIDVSGNGSEYTISSSIDVTGIGDIVVTRDQDSFTVASQITITGGSGISVGKNGSDFTISVDEGVVISISGGSGIVVDQNGSDFSISVDETTIGTIIETVVSEGSGISISSGSGIVIDQNGSDFTISVDETTIGTIIETVVSEGSGISISSGSGIVIDQNGSDFTISVDETTIGDFIETVITNGSGIQITGGSGITVAKDGIIHTISSLIVGQSGIVANENNGLYTLSINIIDGGSV